MQYLVTVDQMKTADMYTINEIGLPSMVLMERAAMQCVEILYKKEVDCSKTLVVCGPGNNGGDGFAIARLLHAAGNCVNVVFVGSVESCTKETALQWKILENHGVCIEETFEKKEYSVIIDALFGVGLKRDITGKFQRAIEYMNGLSGVKFSVDIPSGIHGDTGEIMGVAFGAELTVTFGYEKLGTVLYPGNHYGGRVYVVDIGIPTNALPVNDKIYFTYDESDFSTHLPKRRANTHKGSYGKVLMIVGSEGMAGAAYLSAKAAYVIGAGLVQIYTHFENRAALQTLLPEAIIKTYTTFDKNELHRLIDWADVLTVGCGLGKSLVAKELLKETVAYCKKPCVIDADGLNILSENMAILKGGHFVLTPHLKEMSRMLGLPLQNIIESRFSIISEFVQKLGCICVLKDSRTVVASSEQPIYINTTGNSAMAKAGSGDVLAGVITGLIAQGLTTDLAACLGTYIHGYAGDIEKEKKGSYSVLASDLFDGLIEILKKVEGL